jgi:hypothetical protein
MALNSCRARSSFPGAGSGASAVTSTWFYRSKPCDNERVTDGSSRLPVAAGESCDACLFVPCLFVPERLELHPTEHASFSVRGTDQYGQPFVAKGPSWSAPGCTVSQDGQITVGETLGFFVVTARCGEIEAQAQIHVRAPTNVEEIEDDEEKKSSEAKVIRWKGTIPPQKWTTF